MSSFTRQRSARSAQLLSATFSVCRSPSRLTIVEAGAGLWQEWLCRAQHDVYHTGAYHALQAAADQSAAYLAVYGTPDRFVAVPYLLRPVAGGLEESLMEVTSVYGYGGVLTHGCQDTPDFFLEGWKAITCAWTEQGAVSAFLRFHPVLDNARWFTTTEGCVCNSLGTQGEVRLVGLTAAIDLTASSEDIWRGYSKQLRQALRRCSESGVSVEHDLGWQSLDEFVAAYHATMKRNNANAFYFFDAAYFAGLRDALGQHAHLLVARQEGRVISAALLFEYGGYVNVHLLATDEAWARFSPGKAVLHAAQAWAKARGNQVFHLGGGRGGRTSDSLFRFKASFTRQLIPFCVGRFILKPEAYQFLANRRETVGREQGRVLDPSYFPAYRAPLIDPVNPA